jgi:pimeloyl-ACP methyl ester carboxylesterase
VQPIDTRTPGIECVESGSGEPVIFIPGSYSTSAAWRPMQKLLSPRRRYIATSLCGYGQTDETRTLGDAAITHEVRVVQQVAACAAGPVHLVGHSFGATVALACAISGAVEVASLALFEANPMALLRGGPHQALFDESWRMERAFEAAVHEGERDAPARIIDFWGGLGAFAAMPHAVQMYCRSTAHVNVLDWRGGFGFDVSPADCAALQVPVLLVRGELGNGAMVGITEVLAAHLPRVEPVVVAGASHFLITTHAGVCAGLLDAFLQKVA